MTLLGTQITQHTCPFPIGWLMISGLAPIFTMGKMMRNVIQPGRSMPDVTGEKAIPCDQQHRTFPRFLKTKTAEGAVPLNQVVARTIHNYPNFPGLSCFFFDSYRNYTKNQKSTSLENRRQDSPCMD